MQKNRAAMAVAAGILLSRVAGLVRERVFAYYLGNSDAAGALRAAMRIPNLMQNLFGEGVLSASFIPVYSRLLGRGDDEQARQVATRTLGWLLGVTVFLSLCGWFGAAILVDVLAPGFEGEVRALCIRLVRVLFPGTGILVLSAWCLGILNSHRKFFLSYFAPVVWNGAIIVALMWGSFTRGVVAPVDMVMIAAWGIVAGSVLQWLVQLPLSLKLNRGLAWGKGTLDGQTEVSRNFAPALFSRGVAQISSYVDQILSSFLGAQVVSWFAYSQTLSLLAISLFGMAITASELPELSRESADPLRNEKLRERVGVSRDRLLFFIVPSVVAQIFLGKHIVGAVFQTGQFGATDTYLVWAILAASSIGIPATAESRLLASVFWALGESKRPAKFAFLRMVVSAGIGLASVFYFSKQFQLEPHQTAVLLGLASSISAYVEYFCLHHALNKKLPLRFTYRGYLIKLSAALFAAGVAQIASPYFQFLRKPYLTGGTTLALYGAIYLTLTGGWTQLRKRRAA